MTHNYKPFLPLILILTLTASVPGCRGTADLLASAQTEELAQLRYPEEAQHGPDLDIQLEQHGRNLTVINLEPLRFRSIQLWLNAEYARPIDQIRIGENTFSLRRWINRYGETYPTGSFLAPDQRVPIALAEVYDPSTNLRHKLVVRPIATEQLQGSTQTGIE
ncbi:MAG: hypothetical protein RLN76_08285 [Phycisphaeraceae bacterium]